MRWIFIIFFILPFASMSQLSKIKPDPINPDEIAWPPTVNAVQDEIFTCILEIGIDAEPAPAWFEYLQDELPLDSLTIDTIPAGRYKVVVEFTVDTMGKLGEVSILMDAGFGLGDRVKRVVCNYQGTWKPSLVNNRATRSVRRQPITFVVEETECEPPLPSELIL